MAKDYSVPVLDGAGDNGYGRYMRTDALRSLQRRPDEVIHRDELLFPAVHQSTELWLKLACFDFQVTADKKARSHYSRLTVAAVVRCRNVDPGLRNSHQQESVLTLKCHRVEVLHKEERG